jgi:hypothetical protein
MLLKMLAACKGAGAAPSYEFYDDFLEGTNTLLESHTSDSGHTWTRTTAIAASSGAPQMYAKTGGAASMLVSGSGSLAAYISNYATTDAAVWANVGATYINTNSNYSVMCRANAGGTSWYQFGLVGTNAFQIYRVSSGTFTQLGSTYTFAPTLDFEIKLEIIGTSLVGYVDGVSRVTATDSTHSTGYAGLWHRTGLSTPSASQGYYNIYGNPA